MVHLNLICDHNVAFKRAQVAAMIHSHLNRGHISAFKRTQVCPNQFSHLWEKDVSLMGVGLKITFPVISPEPEVTTMIQIYLIYGHATAFKWAQYCANRLSNLRETDVSSWRAGLKITFPVRSPETEVAAMIHSHLIRGHISAFKRAQFGSAISEKKMWV